VVSAFVSYFAPMKARIAILASGKGSNAEKVIQHFAGHPTAAVVMVLSNNATAGVLQRAAAMEVPTYVFNRQQFVETDEVLEKLKHEHITHIVLAGFLWLIPANLLATYHDRIINIHPALLPRHGGKGMYGSRVHEAVKESGDTETGITIHLVNSNYDEGRIIFQKSCAIDKSDNAAEIASKVHTLEYEHYPRVIEKWISQTSIA
jgi:phosphoribosylglycinamide formyltransferase-1